MSGDGLIFGYSMETCPPRPIGWAELERGARPSASWLHLDRSNPRVARWLAESSGLDEDTVEALTRDHSRPRAFVDRHELVLVMKGANLNAGADPEDMVSLRCVMAPSGLVTLEKEPIFAVRDVAERLVQPGSPSSPPEVLFALLDRLQARLRAPLLELAEQLEDIEDRVFGEDQEVERSELASLRSRAVTFRRHMLPQRDALATLLAAESEHLGEEERTDCRELLDRVTRHVEDLDAIRERSTVLHDEVTSRAAERLNRRMYVLTVLTGLFLPLSFITGLLGSNVGGIPGSESSFGFAATCLLLAGIAGGIAWLLRRSGWA